MQRGVPPRKTEGGLEAVRGAKIFDLLRRQAQSRDQRCQVQRHRKRDW